MPESGSKDLVPTCGQEADEQKIIEDRQAAETHKSYNY
jgi:hypothetical protein